jgi:murein L,D-transpeptidase YafK
MQLPKATGKLGSEIHVHGVRKGIEPSKMLKEHICEIKGRCGGMMVVKMANFGQLVNHN